MKKIICICLLLCLMLVCFCGCSSSVQEGSNKDFMTNFTEVAKVTEVLNINCSCYYLKDNITNLMYLYTYSHPTATMCPLYKNATEVYTYDEWYDIYFAQLISNTD